MGVAASAHAMVATTTRVAVRVGLGLLDGDVRRGVVHGHRSKNPEAAVGAAEAGEWRANGRKPRLRRQTGP